MSNIHFSERVIRFILGFVVLYLAGTPLNIISLIGFIIILTATTNFCPLYKVLNINQKLSLENEFLTKLPKNNPEPILVFSMDGSLVFQNEAAKIILPDVTNFHKIYNKNPNAAFEKKDELSKKYQYKDKVYIIKSIKEKSGFILSYGFDATDIETSRKKLKEQSITDDLTKISNSTKLINDIESLKTNTLYLIVIDIIKFNQINNLFGHSQGNVFLKKIAHELKVFEKSFSYVESVYRLRGNTFALLLNFEELEKKSINKEVEKIKFSLFNIFHNFKISSTEINTNFKIRMGIASTFENNSLLSNAETALSTAKERSLFCLEYTDIKDIKQKHIENLTWVGKLYDIFEGEHKSKLKAYFQPIYNNQTNKIEKYETLVRIEDNNEVISPYFFLDVAKQINYLPLITKEVFSQALKTFENTDYEFSINITTQDLKDKELFVWMHTMLKSSSLEPSCVVLEILEDEDMYEYIDEITNLKRKGFKIAIDDFGTGYSNFKKLQQINADYIKIDGSLIRNITKSQKDLAIVNSICNYAEAIGVKTIAEVVADEDIFELIKNTPVNYSQGYHIGIPKPTID